MKKLIGIMLSLLCLLTGSYCLAAVEAPESCLHCGMDRTKFAHSRMLIQYDDGSSVGLCSLNCAAIDMDEKKDKKVKAIMVADFNTKELINAEKAVWVIGGNMKGVMTMTPKWAFAKKEDAEKFIAESGGELGTYETALKLAKEDKRMKGMKKMGEGAGSSSAPGEMKGCCCKKKQGP